jgi:hypothetical protein
MSVPEKPRSVRGEVLPPLGGHSEPPLAPYGIPLLARLRNWSHQRQFESYTALEAAVNRHLETLSEQLELKGRMLERHAYWNGRASKLSLLQQAAADQVELEVAGMYQDAKIAALHKDLTIAQLEAQLRQARAGPEPTDQATNKRPSVVEELRRLLAQIREFDQAVEEHIQAIISAAGGEDRLTEEDQAHIENMRLLRADKIQSMYEDSL